MAENDIAKVSEGLKKTGIGGLTVFKVKGRGKTIPAEIHTSKGTQIFTPEFGDKYEGRRLARRKNGRSYQ